MTGRKYTIHTATDASALATVQLFGTLLTRLLQVAKVERVSERAEPSVTERFFETTSKA